MHVIRGNNTLADRSDLRGFSTTKESGRGKFGLSHVLERPVDELMLQGLLWSETTVRCDDETFFDELSKHASLFEFVLILRVSTHYDARLDVSTAFRFDRRDLADHLFVSLRVCFDGNETAVVVEVLPSKLSSLQKFEAEVAFGFHHQLQHLIVAPACEENNTSVQFVKSTADGPHVNAVVVFHTENNFRGTIEPRGDVRRDVEWFPRVGRGSKIANLDSA